MGRTRSQPVNDSTVAFCHGESGSMNVIPAGGNRHQSATALEVISVPSSIRPKPGAPWTMIRRSSTVTMSSPVMDRSTSIARAFLVNLSVMFRYLTGRGWQVLVPRAIRDLGASQQHRRREADEDTETRVGIIRELT
jgi:hypothetical protein